MNDRGIVVEHLGLEPSPACSKTPSCKDDPRNPRVPRNCGAWGRFRSHLSAASMRRCHQISFPGNILERPARLELASLRWRRRALPLSYGRSFGAQSRTRTCEARRHLVYSQASLPLEYLCEHFSRWRKADGSNATPCGAHPFSRRGAGHSSGALHSHSSI